MAAVKKSKGVKVEDGGWVEMMVAVVEAMPDSVRLVGRQVDGPMKLGGEH